MSEQYNLRYAQACGTCEHSTENTNLWDDSDYNCPFNPNAICNKDTVCDMYKEAK
jgi:hypothetical protein